MRNIRLFAALILGFAIPIAIYCGQSAVARREPSRPNFPRLFPTPTGQNGYEEFVLAADLAVASPAWQKYEQTPDAQGGPTLASKRSVLADATVQRLLATLRVGLRKRIQAPQEKAECGTLYPELGIFRSVGRLLSVEMDVRFADGQTSRAIDCLNDGLNFGRDVQIGTLLSGVVGLYIENTILYTFSHHLDQLTLADCDKLIHIANHHLRSPDPQIALFTAERAMYLRSLRKYRTDAMALLDKVDPGPNASASDHLDYTTVCRWVRANPDSGAALFDQAAEQIGAHLDLTLAAIRRPAWERTYPEPIERNSLAARLIYSFGPSSYARLGDRFESERALVQILAAHAGVLR